MHANSCHSLLAVLIWTVLAGSQVVAEAEWQVVAKAEEFLQKSVPTDARVSPANEAKTLTVHSDNRIALRAETIEISSSKLRKLGFNFRSFDGMTSQSFDADTLFDFSRSKAQVLPQQTMGMLSALQKNGLANCISSTEVTTRSGDFVTILRKAPVTRDASQKATRAAASEPTALILTASATSSNSLHIQLLPHCNSGKLAVIKDQSNRLKNDNQHSSNSYEVSYGEVLMILGAVDRCEQNHVETTTAVFITPLKQE